MTLTFDELAARSRAVGYPFPTENNRLEHYAATAELRAEVSEDAAGARPIVHERVVQLAQRFLDWRRAHGSSVEQALYRDAGPAQLLDKLLRQRPLMFMGAGDDFRLRDAQTGRGGFERVGTAAERAPLLLAEVNSYAEMQLAALLGVSVPTYFINEGDRHNAGRLQASGHERRGVYVGLVGARFERPGQMEWQHLAVTAAQNTAANGYGADADPDHPRTQELEHWAELYGEGTRFPDYATAAADTKGNFLACGHAGKLLLNARAYMQRMRLGVEPFLVDANARAAAAGRRAYVVAVGLGLGVWLKHPAQGRLLVQAFAEVLAERHLPHLADLDFTWFPPDCDHCGKTPSGEHLRTADNDVKVHFSKRNPAAALNGADQGKLLVASYAWDANAFPGNEYWSGMLTASGDPAAACSSGIPELQNPDINPQVAGDNVHVSTGGTLVPLRDLTPR